MLMAFMAIYKKVTSCPYLYPSLYEPSPWTRLTSLSKSLALSLAARSAGAPSLSEKPTMVLSKEGSKEISVRTHLHASILAKQSRAMFSLTFFTFVFFVFLAEVDGGRAVQGGLHAQVVRDVHADEGGRRGKLFRAKAEKNAI